MKKTNFKQNKNIRKKLFFPFALALALFFIFAMRVLAEEIGREKISNLNVENITEDANNALKDYYGQLFGIVGPNTRFNNIASKDDIAILNVSIDGRDRRILAKLARGVVLPKITDELLAAKIHVNNLSIIDKLMIFGQWLFSRDTSYGKRNFYGSENTNPGYVDEGFSRIINGEANISITPALRDLISGYTVFLSAEGKTQGLYIAEKSGSYFVVRSINPNSNVGFSWMLRGIKKNSGEKLESEYGKKLGIGIKAEINYESNSAKVSINGFDNLYRMLNHSNASVLENNETKNNETNSSIASIANNNTGIKLITGNLVDEFGLETDLGRILGNATPLPALNEGNLNGQNNNSSINQTTGNNNQDLNEISPLANETSVLQNASTIEFTVSSTNEENIVKNVAAVTKLDEDNVRKLITFAYAKPQNFADEDVHAQAKVEGIEKVNGSVIIRLG